MRSSILVVEDDGDIREQIVQILQDEGYEVQGCANGLEALTALRSSSKLPDCVILDLMMPVMDGIEFLESLNHDSRYDDLPVMIATAHARPMAILNPLNRNHLTFINKPMDIDDLLAKVEVICV